MPDPHTASSVEIFTHIRVIVGMVLGLSVSRLVIGLTRFIQHPDRERVYLPHLGWVLFLLLSVIHFWWFEFAFAHRQEWSFNIYFFLIFYAGMFVALASVLFPDNIHEYKGLDDYFRKRRNSFYVLLLGMLAVDMVDTSLKGGAYFEHYGWFYPLHQGALAVGIILAMKIESERFQAAIATLALLLQIVWIASLFEIMP